jgi:hypothetical protein
MIKPVRYHSMDALRAVAMFLGIYMHTAIPMAMIEDVSQHPVPQIIQQWIHMFRMQTFFLVAGFFARFLFHRDGWVEMMKNRSKRILLPLILGCIFILPLTHVMIVYGAVRAHDPNADFPWQDIWNYFEGGRFWTYLFPNYLWFLIYLMAMYVAAIVGYQLLMMMNRNGWVEKTGDWLIETGCKRWYGFLVWAIIGALWMLSMNSITVDLAPFYFMPLAGPFGLYFLFFIAGWLLHRNVELLDELKKRWLYFMLVPIPVLIIAILCFIPVFITSTEVEGQYMMNFFEQFKGMKDAMQSQEFLDEDGVAAWVIVDLFRNLEIPKPIPFNVLAGAMLLVVFSTQIMWAWTFWMVGIFVRFFHTQSRWFRYLADSSYWLYLTHMPLVMYLQVEWAYWDFPWYVKLPLFNLYIIIILLVSYHVLVRSTILGVLLNGRRYPFQFWNRKSTPTQSI